MDILQSMNRMSEPCVGYAKSVCFKSRAGIPSRMATAKTLIISSAWGPRRCAPTMRSVCSSISTLKPDVVSPTLRVLNHAELSCQFV